MINGCRGQWERSPVLRHRSTCPNERFSRGSRPPSSWVVRWSRGGATMTQVETDRERQMREAEELLGPETTRGLAKGLFFGRFDAELAFPYPSLSPAEE